jgi:hypothetical protein
MSNEEIQKIINAAKLATQGKWESNSFMHGYVYSDTIDICEFGKICDGEHIANSCPANIIPLLEELMYHRQRFFEGRLLITSEHLAQYRKGYEDGSKFSESFR